MKQYSVRQKAAIQRAREQMQDQPWFRGVCLDKLPKNDRELKKQGFYNVVDALVCDTIYWDATGFYKRAVK